MVTGDAMGKLLIFSFQQLHVISNYKCFRLCGCSGLTETPDGTSASMASLSLTRPGRSHIVPVLHTINVRKVNAALVDEAN